MPFWAAWGRIHLGWALSMQGESRLDLIEAGLHETRQIGVGRFEPLHLAIAAEACSLAGRHVEAVGRIAQAFISLEAGGDLAAAADLHRTRAAVLLRADPHDIATAENDLRRAFEIATEQDSPSLRLRVARDLSALWAERGDRQQAADLLAPIYAWFTEGFDTPDLVEAKALLEQLG